MMLIKLVFPGVALLLLAGSCRAICRVQSGTNSYDTDLAPLCPYEMGFPAARNLRSCFGAGMCFPLVPYSSGVGEVSPGYTIGPGTTYEFLCCDSPTPIPGIATEPMPCPEILDVQYVTSVAISGFVVFEITIINTSPTDEVEVTNIQEGEDVPSLENLPAGATCYFPQTLTPNGGSYSCQYFSNDIVSTTTSTLRISGTRGGSMIRGGSQITVL